MCYMRKAAVVRARIEPGLKDEAQAVLRQSGLEVSDAIRLFLRQVVQHGGVPFPIQAGVPRIAVVPAAAMEASKRAHQEAERSRPGSAARFLISPERARAARVKWPDADYDR